MHKLSKFLPVFVEIASICRQMAFQVSSMLLRDPVVVICNRKTAGTILYQWLVRYKDENAISLTFTDVKHLELRQFSDGRNLLRSGGECC